MAPMNVFHLFTLGRIPVGATLGYAILMLFFSSQLFEAGIAYGLVGIFGLTLSLLVHEFGHAMAARHYRLSPRVSLVGWGGVCHHQPASKDLHSAVIVVSGPLAGMVLGFAALAAQSIFAAELPQRLLFAVTLDVLVYIGVWWSLVNLLPLWPLDGGQLFQLAARRFLPPAKAEQLTHIVAIVVALAGAIFAFAVLQDRIVGLMAILIGGMNVQRMMAARPQSATPRRQRSGHGDELLTEATQALAAGDPREALRLAHQAKAVSGIGASQLDAAWTLLTVASARIGEWQDALDYSLRAPRIAPVFASRVEALAALGRIDEARRELHAPDAPALPPHGRAALESLVGGDALN